MIAKPSKLRPLIKNYRGGGLLALSGAGFQTADGSHVFITAK